MESVNYYGGEAVGISAVFSAIDEVDGVSVNSIFTKDDIPGYEAYPAHDCPLCRENKRSMQSLTATAILFFKNILTNCFNLL